MLEMSLSTIIELKDINKHYKIGDHDLHILKGVDFSVKKGELVSIMGASGSGKSTMMNIIGLLDQHNDGTYLLDGQSIADLSEDDLATIRGRTIGFVFQQFFLLPRLTALQNVGMPLLYRGLSNKQRKKACEEILEKVGMGEYMDHRPSELSGGQQQRVAIARALVGKPTVLLGDEPTGALDSKIGQEVMDLFVNLNKEEGVTTVIITHDPKVAAQCQRVVHIKDGLIVKEEVNF